MVGHSKVVDLSLPIYSTILLLAQLKAKVWWEYVDSNANISDGPSRTGLLDPVCARLGIPVHQYQWPVHQSMEAYLLSELAEEIIGCI